MFSKILKLLNNNQHYRLLLSACLILWSLSASSFIQFNNILTDTNNNTNSDIQAPLKPHTDSKKRLQQRQLFLQAEQSFKRGQHKKFKQLLTQLDDYPLAAYLHYKQLHAALAQTSTTVLDDFFKRYPNQIISSRLRRDLIRYYARHQQWQKLLHVYRPQSSIKLQCNYLQALIKTGQKQVAIPRIKEVWLSSRSQPKSCDPVFKIWQDAGFKSQALIWQRIEGVMNAGKLRLAKHLARSLSAHDRAWLRLWRRVYRHPESAANENLFKQTHPYAQRIAIHAIKRLSRQDASLAIKLLEQLQTRLHFKAPQQRQIDRIIGLAMARQHLAGAYQWLQKIPFEYADKQVLQWRIRSNIRDADWLSSLKNINALPPTQQASLRWQFWWAYANAQLGRTLEADSAYRYLASKRSYYGFLAADQLQLPYAFENRPLDLEPQTITQLSQLDGARRAHEFFQLGRILNARREWYDMTQQLDDQQKLAAAKLAQQWQWHDRAIYTLGQTTYRDDITLRFPLPLQHSVHAWSLKRQLDPALTYAIIRRESAFMADARSPAGALGLMQLMPGTARNVARKMHIRYRGKNSLLKTDTNIELGTGYLEQMLQRNAQQTVLATAAYNAGPLRVKGWLPNEPMEAIRWIETIPYTETRNYVSNVLAYMVIYQHRMGQSSPRLTQHMPQIPAKTRPLQTVENNLKSKNNKS